MSLQSSIALEIEIKRQLALLEEWRKQGLTDREILGNLKQHLNDKLQAAKAGWD